MRKARTYLLVAAAITSISVLSPTRAKAVQSQTHNALVKSGSTTPGEYRAIQVMSQLLSDIPGKQVVVLAITYPPGYSGAIHRHNAHAFAYVLEGSVVMGLNDGTPVTLAPGQTFYEGPNDIHTISRNASKTKPATFLVFLIKNKNAPVTVPAK